MNLSAENKQDALLKICRLLYADGVISSVEKFSDAVEDRENKGSTGIGYGIAIPHGKSDSVIRSCIAVARLKKPITWGSIDDQPVNLVIMFAVSPVDQNQGYLQAIARIATLLMKDEFRHKLQNCNTARKLSKLFMEIPMADFNRNLYFVAVTACPTGVAHTYIAKERLKQVAQERGHSIKIETQGGFGREHELTQEEINECDVVIIAADIEIDRADRFRNKMIARVPISVAIESPDLLFEKIEKRLKGKSAENLTKVSNGINV